MQRDGRAGAERVRRRLAVAAAASVLAIAGVALFRARRHDATAVVQPAASPSTDAGPPGFGSTMSANPEALALYRDGVAAMWSAAGSAANRRFKRASAIDPSFAAAALREVLTTPRVTDVERANAHEATRLRDTLGEHDRALLHAIEPWVDVPQDPEEVERRLVALTAAIPDPEYLYQLCRFRVLDGHYDAAVEACRAAHARDPSLAAAVWLEGQSLLFVGDTRAGTATLDACLQLSHDATACLNDLLQLASADGRCDAALDYADRLVAIEPENPYWLQARGSAAYAMGKRTASTPLVLDGWWEASDVGVTPLRRAAAQTRFAVLHGDFEDAKRQLDAWVHEVDARGDELSHVQVFEMQRNLARELGQEAAFVGSARSFLASRAAWSPSPDGDGSIDALIALYRGGAMARSELVAKRAAWLASELGRPQPAARLGMTPGRRWITAYAKSVSTREDAADAIAALHEFEPLPSERVRNASDDESIGATYLLAGDAAKALPFLRRAARSCDAPSSPFHHTWASLELGDALARSDPEGACAAYEVVIDRWGSAPGSVSAARARAARTQLGCR